MPRTSLTPTQRADAVKLQARSAAKAAQSVLAVLADPDYLSMAHVCACTVGSAAGITEAECGCKVLDAAKVLEAAGCYIRRANVKGLV